LDEDGKLGNRKRCKSCEKKKTSESKPAKMEILKKKNKKGSNEMSCRLKFWERGGQWNRTKIEKLEKRSERNQTKIKQR